MATIPGMGVPLFVGKGLVQGPVEAEERNAQIRAAKLAEPNNPEVQAMQEVEPGAAGVTEGVKNAIFPTLGKFAGPLVTRAPLAALAGRTGPIGTVGRALGGVRNAAGEFSQAGRFATDLATGTAGNVVVGEGLEAATDPNYHLPKTGLEAAQRVIPAAAFGALHPVQEAMARAPMRRLAAVEPPKPPPLPSPTDVAPELTLVPGLKATTDAAKAAIPTPVPPPPEPVEPVPPPPTQHQDGQGKPIVPLTPTERDAMRDRIEARLDKEDPGALGTTVKLQAKQLDRIIKKHDDLTAQWEKATDPAVRLRLEGEIHDQERRLRELDLAEKQDKTPPTPIAPADPAQRIPALMAELEQSAPEKLEALRGLAGRREWGETEVLAALEKLAAETRAAQPPPLPKSDEQKRTQQEEDVRRDNEQQAAAEPNTVDQVRVVPGNAVADEGAGEQLRQRGVERPGSEAGPVPGVEQDRGVSPEPNAGGEVRGQGERGPSAEKQPVLVHESQATLKAQQQQLVDPANPRGAMMFPKGQQPLKLPKGMKAVTDKNGAKWHYDPKKTTAQKIKAAVEAGTENEILNLGPQSKAEVLAAAARGTPAVVVAERTPGGVEVRAATSTAEAAPATTAEMQLSATPGNTVAPEHPATTIQKRTEATAEEQLAPRPGSLGTPEGQAKVVLRGARARPHRPQPTGCYRTRAGACGPRLG